MELSFDLSTVFAKEPIGLITSEWLTYRNAKKFPAIVELIDELGKMSAKSQHLAHPITSYEKMTASSAPQKCAIYIWWNPSSKKHGNSTVVGFVKTAHKKLYLYDEGNVCHEVRPPCLLDFYIFDPLQRQGYGRQLIDAWLLNEGIQSHEFAIDRPSIALQSFMSKHYGLTQDQMVKQSNKFGIYASFFEPTILQRWHSDEPGTSTVASRAASRQSSPPRIGAGVAAHQAAEGYQAVMRGVSSPYSYIVRGQQRENTDDPPTPRASPVNPQAPHAEQPPQHMISDAVQHRQRNVRHSQIWG